MSRYATPSAAAPEFDIANSRELALQPSRIRPLAVEVRVLAVGLELLHLALLFVIEGCDRAPDRKLRNDKTSKNHSVS